MEKESSQFFRIILGLSLLFPLHTIILGLVNDLVPTSYMDEYFHYDQLNSYVKDEDFLYWNDKITTFPGLYFVDYTLIKFLHKIGFESYKLLALARALNSHFYSLLSFILIFRIFSNLYPENESFNLQRALTIQLMPTIFFYNFLLYTDSGSNFFVLLSFYLLLKGKHTLSGIASIVSVLFRQTNMIWIGYICIWKIIRDKRHHFNNQDPRINVAFQFTELLGILWKDKIPLIRRFKIHILLAIGFIVFGYLNEGIAIGDRSNHQISFHPTQLLYLVCFILPNLSISIDQYIYNFKMTIKRIFTSKALFEIFVLLTIMSAGIVHWYTLEHPFILSDNRHYTFYVWKNFFKRYEWFKYAMCPVYSAAIIYIIPLLINSREKLLLMIFWLISSGLVLIPTKLIEPRYYAMPLLFLQFEIKPQEYGYQISPTNQSIKKQSKPSSTSFLSTSIFSNLTLNIIFYLIVDAILFYMFLYRPFNIEGSKELGRFMW